MKRLAMILAISSLSAQGVKGTINLSRSAPAVDISGGEGLLLLDEITNTSIVTDEKEAYASLSQWGSSPKAIPPPPDSRSAKSNEIIRFNHLGY